MNFLLRTAILAAACLVAPSPATAAESYATCVGYVDTLPATISTPGTWCLRKDLVAPLASGTAITIAGADVTLDCNGFRLANSAVETTAVGVRAEFMESPVVRRCHVRGFDRGAFLYGSAILVEDNRFEDNALGVHVGQEYGADNFNRTGAATVRRNTVVDSRHTGIEIYGRVSVLDNVVDGVGGAVSPSQHIGISTGTGGRGVIAGNVVRNVDATAEFGAIGIGGYSTATDQAIRDNVVIAIPGLPGSTGVLCPVDAIATYGNQLSGWATAVEGCTSHDDIVVP